MRRKMPASLNGSGDVAVSSGLTKCLIGAGWAVLVWLSGRPGWASAFLRRVLPFLPVGAGGGSCATPRDY